MEGEGKRVSISTDGGKWGCVWGMVQISSTPGAEGRYLRRRRLWQLWLGKLVVWDQMWEGLLTNQCGIHYVSNGLGNHVIFYFFLISG